MSTPASLPRVEPACGDQAPPVGRTGLAWRYTLASLPLLVGLSSLALDWPADPLAAGLLIADPLLFPVAVILIRLRNRHPLAVAVALSVVVGLSRSSSGFWAWAVITMATRRRWRWVAVTGVVTLLATLVSVAVTLPTSALDVQVTGPDGATQPFTDPAVVLAAVVAMNLVVYFALVAWGFYLGARRELVASLTERAETAEREQAWRIAQAQGDERARIAREMHDVLAHRISLVSMHAGVLAYRDDLNVEETAQVARIIQTNAAESLTELRAVLGVLREPSATPAKPQPTLADLPALLDESREAGTHLSVSDDVTSRAALPPATGRHAYRILQEALTNARKHAVGAPVHVALSGRPVDGLSLEVANPLTSTTGLPGAALGLVGLRERAQLAGGWCTARVEQGRFVVRAWLPWPA